MIGALLFDMDGTLLETDHLHAEVFDELGAEHGVRIDRAMYDRDIHGRLNEDVFPVLFPGQDPVAMADEKEARFRVKLGHAADPLPGLVRLLDWARVLRIPVAVVSNAPRANVTAMLSATRLTDRFKTVIAGGEVLRGKPDPMPYLSTAERLGVAPGRCVVFEDSPSGIRAGAAAKMHVFGLRTSLDDATLRAAGAAASLADFDDPILWAYLATKRQ